MAGYKGYSMSNNAVIAYENGEKPLSKWSKAEIIEIINKKMNSGELTVKCNIEKLKKVPLKVLRELCLIYTSWHHTSSHYNMTNFYSIDISGIEKLTDEMIDKAVSRYQKEKDNPEEKWECSFLEWSGTRRHPKAIVKTEIGIVKGKWFYRADGSKKKITANGFEFIRKVKDV